jgi:simple sugar transport system permease protein
VTTLSPRRPARRRAEPRELLYRWGTVATVALLLAAFGLAVPGFLSAHNLVNILRSIAIVTVIGLGVSLSLAVGGFDLSVGSTASLADAVVISAMVRHGAGTAAALSLAVAACLAVGLLNAFLVVRLRIPDLLATLASMFVVQGAAMTYSRGGSITAHMVLADGSTAPGALTPAFEAIGQVPAIILVMLVAVVAVQLVLSFTTWGRYLYIVGGNAEAARLTGLAVGSWRAAAYLASSVLAAVGGILLASRIGSSQVNAGSAYLMDAVAAAYIGYSLGGSGKANAVGTFVGAVLNGVLQNGLVMLSVPYYAMDVVKGGVLALALALTYLEKR